MILDVKFNFLQIDNTRIIILLDGFEVNWFEIFCDM